MIEVIAYRVYGETGWIVPPEKIEAETVKEARAKVREHSGKREEPIYDDKGKVVRVKNEILLQTREITKT